MPSLIEAFGSISLASFEAGWSRRHEYMSVGFPETPIISYSDS